MTTADPRAPAETEVPATRTFGRGLAIFFIFLGVATIGAGILALIYPGITLLVISLLFGINLIVFSSFDLAEALFDGADVDTTHRVLGAILGILGLIAGLVVLRHPFDSLAVIVLALGIYLIVAGVIATVKAFQPVTSDRAARMLAGVATLAFGVIILSVPGLSLATLAVLAGIGMMARGITAILIGLVALKTSKEG